MLGLRALAVYVGGKYLTRLSGEPQDGNGFAGVSFTGNGGDGASVTHVRGFTVLDHGFDLSGRVPIAPGRSPLVDTEISAYTSANRPLAAPPRPR